MRTTLTIDDDILASARDRARRDRTTVGKVLSDLARETLTRSSTRGEVTMRNGFPVLPSRGGVVTNELINSIRDEIGV